MESDAIEEYHRPVSQSYRARLIDGTVRDLLAAVPR